MTGVQTCALPILKGYDYGLEYSSWDRTWSRFVYLDLRGVESDYIYLKAIVSDTSGNNLTVNSILEKDMICNDPTGFNAEGDLENGKITLTWSVPDDYDYGYLYKGNYSNKSGWQWQYLSYVDSVSYVDTSVAKDNSYKTYKYRLVIYDKSGNECMDPPEITFNFPVQIGRAHV